MRIFEFDNSEPEVQDVQGEGIINLLTILNHLIEQAKHDDVSPSVSTSALINMVSNTGVVFDYNALVNAHESNAAVQNLIKNFSQETVDLIGSPEDEMGGIGNKGEDSGEAVARIAKRVAKRNIG